MINVGFLLFFNLSLTFNTYLDHLEQLRNRWYTLHRDKVAEWLRRWTANPMGSARVGSNPILVDAVWHEFEFLVAN